MDFDSQQLRCPLRFGFANSMCFSNGQVFQAQLAGGQKHNADVISVCKMLSDRAAATDAFVVGMRSQDQNIHALSQV